MNKILITAVIIIVVGIGLWYFLSTPFLSTPKQPVEKLVVYTSRDQTYSEPILKKFEEETGIKVLAVYDTGAIKTVGIANKLIAEKNNPQADVFWNSETIRTIKLKNEGVLASYCSPSAQDIPDAFKDAECYWTGFGARARVIIYNTDLLTRENVPESIFDLTLPEWRGKVALGRPWLGTMSTHHAALFLTLGDEKAKEYFEALKANDIQILTGNSLVRDSVARGEYPVGIIDTSDAMEAFLRGLPVDIVYPDQKEDEIGALIIPNTISLIKNGPNPDNGKKFIDFMLSKRIEQELAYSRSSQIPLRDDVPAPEHVKRLYELKVMDIDLNAVAEKVEESDKYLLGLFGE